MTYERLFDKCYIPLVETKYFHALIDNEPFFDQPVKNALIIFDNVRKIMIGPEDDYITDFLLDYPCFKENYI